jgi:hypothetical protein
MLASSDHTPLFLHPGRLAVDEELVNVERPEAPAEDVRRGPATSDGQNHGR